MTELFQALTVAAAREILSGHLPDQRPAVQVPLLASFGLCLATDVYAVEGVPGFDRSTMDGYAVRAGDTYGATEAMPAYLDVCGEVSMGMQAQGSTGVGQAWRIPTGGMLPPGADAVVMVEYTEELDDRTIGVTKPAAPGENVVRAGDDAAPGEIVLPKGHRIRPQDLGILAAVGVDRVTVNPAIRVGIISTGDELVPPEDRPGPAQVRDVNSYTLWGAVEALGGQGRIYGIIKDNFDQLREALELALAENDMVLLSGGSSVGTRDVASKVIDTIGKPGVLFHGIAVKPGKPTIGAVVRQKPVFGLPGHPVSAMVVFDLLVAPLVRTGTYPCSNDIGEFPLRAIITRSMSSAAGREDFIPVKLFSRDGLIHAQPVLGKSGLIATMVKADGLAYIPSGKEGIEAGQEVAAKLF